LGYVGWIMKSKDKTFNLLEYMKAYRDPPYFSNINSWHKHIPFGFLLIQILEPRILVELGTHKGDSYCAFCQAVKALKLKTECYAIDTWNGDPQTGSYGPEVLKDLRAYHDRLYGKFSTLMPTTFDKGLKQFKNKSVDLLHIDGLHSYDVVLHDFELWLPKMSERGIVLFHDTRVKKKGFGVWKLWREISKNYLSFEFEHGYGLGVLMVGEKPPARVFEFLNFCKESKDEVSSYFQSIGQLVFAKGVAGQNGTSSMGKIQMKDFCDLLLEDSVRNSEGTLKVYRELSQTRKLLEAALKANNKFKETKKHLKKFKVLSSDLQKECTGLEASEKKVSSKLDKTLIDLATQKESYDRFQSDFKSGKTRESELTLRIFQARRLLEEKIRTLENLKNEFEARGVLADQLKGELNQVQTELKCLLESRSVKITAPLRNVVRLLNRLFNGLKGRVTGFLQAIFIRLPLSTTVKWRLKSFVFGRFGLFFKGTEAYHVWSYMFKNQHSAGLESGQNPPQVQVDFNEKLSFKKFSSPEVSIIIPVYGQIEYTFNCLKSLGRLSSQYSYEIIVVDDCSRDDTGEILSRVEGIRRVKNKRNLGFIRSCNKGASLAKGKYVLFLNNDTEVSPSWMDELVKTFEAQPDAGIVGSKLVYPGGKIQEAGGIIWNDGTGWNYGRNQDSKLPEFNYLREVDYCSGASLMIPKTLFDELQGFDERYIPAYYEDTDLAFAVRSKGKKIFYQPLSQLIHFEGISSGTDMTKGVKSYQEANRHKFTAKWQEVLPSYGENGKVPFLAKERNIVKRILVIDACTPTPDKDAGSVETFNFLKIFKSLGFAVTFIPADNFLHVGKYTTDLQCMGVQCLYAPYVTDVLSHLKNYGYLYDLVLLYRVNYAYLFIDDVREHCPNAKIIFDTVDLHYLREERQAKIEGSESLVKQALETKKKEIDLMKKADTTIVLSEAERETLLADHPGLSIYTISLTLEISNHVPSFSKRKEIMFVGGFQHMPNVDAVLNFVHSTWPGRW